MVRGCVVAPASNDVVLPHSHPPTTTTTTTIFIHPDLSPHVEYALILVILTITTLNPAPVLAHVPTPCHNSHALTHLLTLVHTLALIHALTH